MFPKKRPSGNEQKELSLFLYSWQIKSKIWPTWIRARKGDQITGKTNLLVLTQDHLSGKVYLLVTQYFIPDFTTE